MIKTQIDFQDKVPIFLQITTQIRQQILTGVLKPGDQLPTVRLLADELGINFNTVARAYRLLDEEGLVSAQLGRGTYVCEAPSEKTKDQLRQDCLDDLTQAYINQIKQIGVTENEIARVFETHLAVLQGDEKH